MKPQKNVLDLLPKLKSMALADRAVFEKGMKAFVSYIQAYAKHECNLIFRIKGNSQQDWYLLLFFRRQCLIWQKKHNTVVLFRSYNYPFLFSKLLSAMSDSDKTPIFSSNSDKTFN